MKSLQSASTWPKRSHLQNCVLRANDTKTKPSVRQRERLCLGRSNPWQTTPKRPLWINSVNSKSKTASPANCSRCFKITRWVKALWNLLDRFELLHRRSNSTTGQHTSRTAWGTRTKNKSMLSPQCHFKSKCSASILSFLFPERLITILARLKVIRRRVEKAC